METGEERKLSELGQGRALTRHGWPSLLGALPFLGFGVLALRSEADQLSAFVFTRGMLSIVSIGVLFMIVGITGLTAGVVGLCLRGRSSSMRRAHPSEPWLWDHPWTDEAQDGVWQEVRHYGLGFLLLGCFLAGFVGVTLESPAGMFQWAFGFFSVLLVLVLFILLGCILRLLRRYGRFGISRLRLTRVPFFLGDSLQVELLPTSRALGRLQRLTVTLRCIQQRVDTESEISGRVCYERYSAITEVDASPLAAGQPLRLSLELPQGSAERYSTDLVSDPPRYWELTLKDPTAGSDYEASFLLPIYARSVPWP